MIKRELTSILHHLAEQFRVLAILGPRQSGKTTITQEAFSKHVYVSLEDSDIRSFAEKDPRAFLQLHNNDYGIILDEIQQSTPEEMLAILTRVSDNCKLVLCGDINQRDIKGESGLEWFLNFAERHNLPGVGIINFDSVDDIIRGGLCRDVIKGMIKDGKLKK